MQLPNGSGWPWRQMKKEKQKLMLALIKGVVNVGVVKSLKLILLKLAAMLNIQT